MTVVVNQYKDALNQYLKIEKDSYAAQHSAGALKLGSSFYLIEKPRIETNLWFPDEGEGLERCKQVTGSEENTKEYFLIDNLKEYNVLLKKLENSKGNMLYLFKEKDNNTIYLNFIADWEDHEGGVKATLEERISIINALKFGKAEFEKRLNAYLKKYGVSKLNISNYWANR